MLAFLKLIPLKDWLYGGAIIALLIGFALYTHHERVLGEHRVEAADARLAAEVDAKNKAISAAAQAASTQIGQVYEKVVALPPVGDLGVVCHAPRSSPVPAPASGGPGNPEAPARGVGPAFDPTGPALTVGRDADAQINSLIDEVLTLQKAMKEAGK